MDKNIPLTGFFHHESNFCPLHHLISKVILVFAFQPFAWEAREFLRKKLIGKEVLFSVEYKVPGTGREYGCIYLQKGI